MSWFKLNSFFARVKKVRKIGFFDGIHSSGYLYGWAINPQEAGRTQKIYIFINNILVGSAYTWQDRPDVSKAKRVNGSSAGFYFALTSSDFFQLLLPGGTLTIAFDALAREPIAGEVTLDKQNISKIFAGSLREMASKQGEKPLKAIEPFFSKNSVENLSHWSDRCCILADYFFAKLDCVPFDALMLSRFDQIAKDWGISDSILELKLIHALYLVDDNAMESLDLRGLEVAFLDRWHSSDPMMNFSGLENRVIWFMRSLKRRLYLYNIRSSDNSNYFKLCFLLAKWSDKLGLPSDLAISFLDLIGQEKVSALISDEASEFIGKLNRRANRNALAVTCFQEAIASNRAGWFSYHELGVLIRLYAQSDLKLSEKFLKSAISYWIKASELNRSQNLSIREASGYLDHFFDKTILTTTQAINSGIKHAALEVRRKNIALLKENSLALYAASQIEAEGVGSQEWVQKNNPKIIFLGSKDLAQCFHYRTIQKMEFLKSLGLKCVFIDTKDLGSNGWQELLMGAQLLYCVRIALANNERRVLSYAKALRIPIAYDIDDLIFNSEYFPPKLETYANSIDQRLHNHLLLDCPLFSEAMSLADYVTVSTNSLAGQVKEYIDHSAKIFLLPNLLDYSLEAAAIEGIKQDNSRAPLRQISKNKKSRIKIFYGSGTKAHKQVFYDVFLPAVIEVLQEHSNVELHLIGHFDNLPESLLREKRIILSQTIKNFKEYLSLLREMDINIAVLEDSMVTDAKSEIKWLEAAAFAIPSVVSPTATYSESLKSGQNVLFASTPSDWKAQLELLISNPAAREQIGNEAQKLALKKFNPDTGVSVMRDLLATVGVLPKKKRKKRILLCNVYFAPQSNGGATRVAETQVRGLLENYPDEYDVYVLTTSDFMSTANGEIEVNQYWYRNCLVTRLSLPSNDWGRAEDEGVLEFCKRFFAEYQFDLIHMHSMQVLTGSVGLAAQSLNIPYIVTLHDAWWLSRYMFLVDEFGNAVDPSDPLSGGSSKSNDESKFLIHRDKVLRGVLNGANTILAVSQKFADLYIKAGIKGVQVHENIVEPFEVFERISEADGKIVLGFIGGMSKHKGYHLFRQALEEGDFPNFKALIVDARLDECESYETVWGSTSVKFIPKVKQSEIGKLYAQMDVLVAPSIWPESFGLVTREAIRAGVWVIASDMGAIGDAIVEKKNGNIFHVHEMQSLNKLISQMGKFLNNHDCDLVEQSLDLYFKRLVKFYGECC